MQTWKDPQLIKDGEERSRPQLLAAEVAESIGIPFVCLDIQDRFYQQVVRNFIKQYMQGKTPNPCLFCNPQVKWGILQSYALEVSNRILFPVCLCDQSVKFDYNSRGAG